MSLSRPLIRLGVSIALALSFVSVFFLGQASAAPVCAPTPSGTTCVDPAGNCLVTFYPKFGPAMCLRNPIGSIITP
jgi:hypothetical protein